MNVLRESDPINIQRSNINIYEELIEAVETGNLVKFRKIDDSFYYGGSPLRKHFFSNMVRFASDHGHVNIVRYLVERKGIRTESICEKALTVSAEKGHLDVVDYFLRKKLIRRMRFYNEAMVWAAEAGHLKIVKLLVDHGANPHAEDDQGMNWAKENGHDDVVEYLKNK